MTQAQMTDVGHHEHQITINAPAQKIFAVAVKLKNIPRYVPGMSDAIRTGDTVTIKYSPQLPGVNLPLPMSFSITWSLSGVQEPTALTMDMDGPVKGIMH